MENKDFFDKMRSGDVLLFSGNSCFSKTIKIFTKSKYSHVGMVADKDGVLLCVESDESPISKDCKENGVRSTDIYKRIELYDGEVYWRSIESYRGDPSKWSSYEDFNKKFFETIEAFYGVPYEKNLTELFKSAYDGPFGENKEDLSSLFCSEFVAETFKRLGLIEYLELPSNEYTPADFSTNFSMYGGSQIIRIK